VLSRKVANDDATALCPAFLHPKSSINTRTQHTIEPRFPVLRRKISIFTITPIRFLRLAELPVSNMQDLPADILFLVCEEIARKRDFATLFTCAVSSKSLVKPALLWMYRSAMDPFPS